MQRHSKVYRNFAAEFDRQQAERIAAFREFVADVEGGAFPRGSPHRQQDEGEMRTFLDLIDGG
jgi:3-methyl-2-oxobutanoate hydroxymethyltransferase